MNTYLKKYILKILGVKFFKVVQYHYWLNKIKNEKYFEPELEIAKKIIEPGDTVIDVGAHFGRYTIPFSRRVGKRGKVFAIEPVKTTFNVLKKIIHKLKRENITLFNCALSDHQHSQTIVIPVNENGIELQSCSFLTDDTEKYADKDNYHVEETAVETIDNIIGDSSLQKIKLIKCDVEGAELFVLKGAVNTIKKYSPILLLEIVAEHTAKYNYSPVNLLQFMENLGYNIYAPVDGKLTKVSQITDTTINYFFIWNKTAYSF